AADAHEVDRVLEVLAMDTKADIHSLAGGRIDGTYRVYDSRNNSMFYISPTTFGVLVAKAWIRRRSASPAWVISEEGALEYNRRRLDREDARAEAQADRDHNI